MLASGAQDDRPDLVICIQPLEDAGDLGHQPDGEEVVGRPVELDQGDMLARALHRRLS